MEWVYLILILIFIVWSIQLIFVYVRQAEKLDAQIKQAQVSQEDVVLQAEKYEAQAEEKGTRLRELESKASELESKEKQLGEQISSLKQKEASRRPTRHRVDNPEPEI